MQQDTSKSHPETEPSEASETPEAGYSEAEHSEASVPSQPAKSIGQPPVRRKPRFGWLRSPLVRRSLALVGIVLLGWLGFTLVRTQKLKAQTQRIGSRSQGFKTDYYVGAAQDPPVIYMALGDSTAVGWGAEKLETTYPYKIAQAVAARGYHVHVVNVAQAGATIGDVCQKQLVFLWTTHPDFISVSVGANDATHGTSDNDYIDSLQTLITSLQGSEAQLILLGNTPDMYQVPALPWPLAVWDGARARRYNQVIASIKPNPRLEIVDLYGQGQLDYHQDPGLYAEDLFHPSGRGYARWADLFIAQLFPDVTPTKTPAKK